MKEFDIDLGFDGGVQFEPSSQAQGSTGQSGVNQVQGRDTRSGSTNTKISVGRGDVKPVEVAVSVSKSSYLKGFDGSFDIDLGFDGGVQFEPTSQAQGSTGKSGVNQVQGRDTRSGSSNVKVDVGRGDVKPVEVAVSLERAKYLKFEGEDTQQNIETKKSWTDTLDTLTQQFKDVTGFKTNEELQAEKEQELAEKGTKYKVFGMNPFVAIGLSLAVIIGGSYALTKIKAK